ncbi:MAG: trypsin-like peptidase domain-containing protein [Planctomycetes bacterium]|nr:trypsin-like peptidase domain-containing protein [Planctomycetota bacterium]
MSCLPSCTVLTDVEVVQCRIREVCIERNSVADVDLSGLLADAFRRKGLKVTVVDAGRSQGHEFVVRYSTRSQWDFATYMADARVEVFRRSTRVGGLSYSLPDSGGGLSWSKWDSPEEKLGHLIDKMLSVASLSSSPEITATAEPFATGSGFFITRTGFLVTNYHVIGESSLLTVTTKIGEKKARVVAVDKAGDLAILKVEGEFDALPVVGSAGVRLGDTVGTVGFPNPAVQGFEPKLSKGEIAGLAGIGDDQSVFQISAPIQPGNSGGALFDDAGRVVGVVVAKLRADVALATSGALPENVNYAIKSALLVRLIQSAGVQMEEFVDAPGAGRSFSDIVARVVAASVLVKVY